MIKKIFIGIGIVVLLLIGSAFAIPYFFKDQIRIKITEAINEKVDAKVSFANADLSLFKSFPHASVTLSKLLIINKAPFEGDTLVAIGELNLEMSVKELFKKDKSEAINIDAISTKDGFINIIFNLAGQGNYDIALKDNKKATDEKSSPLNLKITAYNVENYKFQYFDQSSKIRMVIDSLNHSGTGDFAASKLDLVTKSTAKVSLDMDKTNYMNKISLNLDAVLGIDLEKSKYTFKDNKAKINELPLEFNGFIQLVKEGQEYDLSFKTPTSSFKNFLGLIPATYASKIGDVKTTGDFSVIGFAKGLKSDTSIPKFSVAIASNNASFQYPNLPKSVQNIVIDTKIINETGVMNDTYVNLDQLSFQIDKDVFNAKANIKNISQNALVDAALKGTINLGNLSKAYPIKMKTPLSGILKADVTSKFDMKSVENSQYQNINNAGTMSLSGFNYTDNKGKVMKINTAMIQFNPRQLNLQEFKATTGKSDISITGILDNFYGFVFKKQELKGNFNMVSNQIAVSDFMTTTPPSVGGATSDDEKNVAKKSEALKIPAFLNCAITAKANTVLYDNLILKNVSGKMIIRDQKVTLQDVKTNIFDGQIGLNGAVSTKEKTPNFNMNLSLNKVDIAQTCSQLEMMKKIAPIAGVINGKLNSTIKLSGNLNALEMTPDMNSVSGDLLGQLLSTTVNPSNSALLTGLTSNFKFLDLKKLNLNDIKAFLTFKDGKVSLKPFDIKYQDIVVNVLGTHSFDQTMSYNLKLNVPAKYLGTEAQALIAKLSPSDVKNLDNIPINALISGNFKSPKITTDLKQATTSFVSNMVKQQVTQQKEKLTAKGKSALEGIITRNNKSGDTTKTKAVVKQAGDLLNGLFGKKK